MWRKLGRSLPQQPKSWLSNWYDRILSHTPPLPKPGAKASSFSSSDGLSQLLFPLGTKYLISLSPNFFLQALQNIAKTWDVIQLDIVPYKDKGYHRLR